MTLTPGAPACAQAGGVVTCDLGTLASGGADQVVVEVAVPFGTTGTLTSSASVVLDPTDPVGANNAATETTTVAGDVTYVFSDGFESGATSAWSAAVNGG